MSFSRFVTTLIVVALGFCAASAQAAERILMFSGNLDFAYGGMPTVEGDPPMPVFPDLPAPFGGVVAGSAFMLEITYDDASPNEIGVIPGFESELPILQQTLGYYSNAISVSLSFDGIVADLGAANALITNHDPLLISQLDTDCEPQDYDQLTFSVEVIAGDGSVGLFALALNDATGDAIDNVDLPSGLDDLAGFSERITALFFSDDPEFDLGDIDDFDTPSDDCDPFENVILTGSPTDPGDGDDNGDGDGMNGGGEIPTPGALPAGLALIALLASRRRRR